MRAIAEDILASFRYLPDNMLKPWLNATVSSPKLVYTQDLDPSHWMVPIHQDSIVLGYIDVSLQGTMMGHAYFYQDPDDLSGCPSTVTRLSREDAIQQAQTILDTFIDAEFSEPIYVFDNFRDQLAWMIEVRKHEELISRVFVTLQYVYQRDRNEEPPPKGLRG